MLHNYTVDKATSPGINQGKVILHAKGPNLRKSFSNTAVKRHSL